MGRLRRSTAVGTDMPPPMAILDRGDPKRDAPGLAGLYPYLLQERCHYLLPSLALVLHCLQDASADTPKVVPCERTRCSPT